MANQPQDPQRQNQRPQGDRQPQQPGSKQPRQPGQRDQ